MSIPEHARGYEGFEGVVGRTSAESTPWWPDEHSNPGAPNIIVVLLDDMGYSDIGPFGSEIDTPNLDRLAATGVRLSNYHTTPVCSPARAALLTGLNPHRAGYGSVANSDPGYPGLRLELADDVLSLPEALRANGYATYAVGKWHLARDSNLAPGRTRDSWPLQRGFDRYYGSLEGLNSFFHPNQITVDNDASTVEEYPDGYYLTDDLTDQAVSYIKALRAHDGDKPFFLYFAHVAMHGPHQAKAEDIAKYRGKYGHGWDAVRKARFAKQLAEGIFPEGTEAAPRNTEPGFDAPEWDSLSAEEQDRYARYMEVYAAMVDNVDQSIGRLLDTVEALGELDDTIVVFTSDNGGTAEGGPVGTRTYFSQFVHHPVPSDWDRDVAHDPALIGSERLGTHYPRGWGQASNTPFRFYKGQTFAGGVRVPFLVSWPAGLGRDEDDDGVRHQYGYVTDVFATLLDLAGLEAPAVRGGREAQERDGVSLAEVLRKKDLASPHTEQYAEFGGHRGYYKDGWKLVTLHRPGTPFTDGEWQLYDTSTDPTELHDVAARFPETAKELAAAWEEAAWRNTVFPLQNGFGARRRPSEARLSRPVRILPGTPVLERYRSAQLVQYRSFTVDAELAGDGGDGVLVAHGDPQGGYVLYVEDGQVHFGFNQFGRPATIAGDLPAGTRLVRLHAAATPRLRWDFTVSVGADAASLAPVAELPGRFQLVGMAPWTGISIGRDARGPVLWDLRERRGLFPFNGELTAVTYTPGPLAFGPEEIREIQREAELAAD
ncbi:arylsulfatase [Glycomyces harbinensis]|uniref:Arylsulfatase n=1 Tax=Glycomyces harbinensis TaxID=58114 RepID=A0A1G6RVB5_9ACTN|nr:arylsulfatase [Glycomyces harbinensis]SDD08344.1 arylsulfatase [Glycomyces harbinensis]